mmetsp:Transcript_2878/g.13443  ORF Transcript_2878/g.13443 Transcript_2878/m.13443 type:complete len:229 (+) Transcript_2878:2480-3166(+)
MRWSHDHLRLIGAQLQPVKERRLATSGSRPRTGPTTEPSQAPEKNAYPPTPRLKQLCPYYDVARPCCIAMVYFANHPRRMDRLLTEEPAYRSGLARSRADVVQTTWVGYTSGLVRYPSELGVHSGFDLRLRKTTTYRAAVGDLEDFIPIAVETCRTTRHSYDDRPSPAHQAPRYRPHRSLQSPRPDLLPFRRHCKSSRHSCSQRPLRDRVRDLLVDVQLNGHPRSFCL